MCIPFVYMVYFSPLIYNLGYRGNYDVGSGELLVTYEETGVKYSRDVCLNLVVSILGSEVRNETCFLPGQRYHINGFRSDGMWLEACGRGVCGPRSAIEVTPVNQPSSPSSSAQLSTDHVIYIGNDVYHCYKDFYHYVNFSFHISMNVHQVQDIGKIKLMWFSVYMNNRIAAITRLCKY